MEHGFAYVAVGDGRTPKQDPTHNNSKKRVSQQKNKSQNWPASYPTVLLTVKKAYAGTACLSNVVHCALV